MCMRIPLQKLPKVVILGIESSGKSTLYNYLKSGVPGTTTPTKRFSQSSVNIQAMKSAKPSILVDPRTGQRLLKLKHADVVSVSRRVSLFDISGMKAQRERWIHHLQNVDRIVFVIDSSAPLQPQLTDLKQVMCHPHSQEAQLIICLNKSDTGADLKMQITNFVNEEPIFKQFLNDESLGVVRTNFQTGLGVGEIAQFLCV
ncbi:ADP-ribosylation_factor [Hexamita inflata]|uniref:ADP-ribosylation factor n=1 Tax=Hexamita inflata TaxID=28002 RepID=A0AA86QKZ9_9EUKA|nr:ADP-ribosylation factor [Hexamita inflata]